MKRIINVLLIFTIILSFSYCKKNTDLKMTDIEYGKHKNQKMDIALPNNIADNQKVPIIFCIHGGGWISGDKSDFDYLKKNCNKYGYAYVSINYRLLGDDATFYDMLDDIHSAIYFLKKNSSKYHLKTDKLGMIGSSAGAHLAMLYSYQRQSDIKVALVVSRVGPADFCDPAFINESKIDILDGMNKLTGSNVTVEQVFSPDFQYPEAWKLSSPIHFVNSTIPPTILAYGMVDELVPYSNAIRIDEKLTQFNVHHKLISFPNSGHSLSNDKDKETEYNKILEEFLEKYLP